MEEKYRFRYFCDTLEIVKKNFNEKKTPLEI